VAQVVAQNQAVPMSFVAIKDVFAKSGTPEQLLERHGLTADAIEKAVTSAISRKK
jgi:transketolase